jgi:hypothetical protein
MHKKSILLILISLFFFSCRYDEGSMISFRTVENRVSQDFILVEYTKNGVDCKQELIDSLGEFWDFQDYYSGGATLLTVYNSNSNTYGGIYEISSNKQKISIIIQGGISIPYSGSSPFKINCTNIWEIKRLTKNDMWLKCEVDNIIYFIKFEKR